MKYIKTYEEGMDRRYRVGDVIVYGSEYDEFGNPIKMRERMGTIFYYTTSGFLVENKFPTTKVKIDSVYEWDVIRLATSYDYEEFELKSKAETYNL